MSVALRPGLFALRTDAALSLLPSRMWEPHSSTNNSTHKYEPDCVGCQWTLSDWRERDGERSWRQIMAFRTLSDFFGQLAR